jgi:hypothetical protein
VIDAIGWLVSKAAALLIAVFGWAILVATVAVVGPIAMFVWQMARDAYASDRSMWYHAGRASVYAELAARQPRTFAVVITTVSVAHALTTSLDAIAEQTTQTGSRNPPPEVSPIHEDNLRMPTAYPFERLRLTWPPFIGHRFSVGGDRS